MRTYPLALPGMFMVAVTLAGCDQVPNEPDTESTALYQPSSGDGSASTYDVVFSATSGWDIQTDSYPDEHLGRSGVGKNSSQIEIGGAGRENTFRMSAAFLTNLFPEWETCFGVDGDGTDMGGFSGDMKPDKRGGGVTTTFYFNRVPTGSSTAISYVLTLNGTPGEGEAFPPASGETTTVRFTPAGSAVIASGQGGGKGKKGSNGGSACVGDAVLSPGSHVTVENKTPTP